MILRRTVTKIVLTIWLFLKSKENYLKNWKWERKNMKSMKCQYFYQQLNLFKN